MKKKVLFITPQLPFPAISGGLIYSNKAVECLALQYDLKIASLLKEDDEKNIPAFLSTYNIKEYYFEPLDIPRNVKNLVISNIKNIPLNLLRNQSKTFTQQIELLAKDVDAIFVDHYVMYQHIPANFKGQKILHQHNCEYLMWKRFADIESNFLKKIAILNQSYHIKKYEQKICKNADVILASINDINELVKIGANKNKCVEVCRLADDSFLNLPDLQYNANEKSLLYIGTLSWEANIDGLLWFFKDIWHLIKAEIPEIKLYIVGKNPSERLTNVTQNDNTIIYTGFVEDLEDYFSKCTVFITPLRFGSGVKLKVVTAMYRGIPCVTTTIGAEGMDLKNNVDMLINDDAKAFAKNVCMLVNDEKKWTEIAKNSRAIVTKNYSWQNEFKKMYAVIDNYK